MKKGYLALALIIGLAYFGYSEYRVSRMQDDVKSIGRDVRDIKGQVEELTQVVNSGRKLVFSDADRKCLAMNIFYEAGVEDHIGKVAVAHVTLNRWKTKRWGDSICSVVYAKAQFSWTLDKKKRHATPKGKLWNESQKVAKEVLDGARVSTLNGSLFYHTDYIKTPKWADERHLIEQIGQHIFYTKAKVVIKKKPKTNV